MPRRRKRVNPTFVPYIYSGAELKRLLEAIPVATEGARLVIDADTLRTFLLLLYGAAPVAPCRGQVGQVAPESVNGRA